MLAIKRFALNHLPEEEVEPKFNPPISDSTYFASGFLEVSPGDQRPHPVLKPDHMVVVSRGLFTEGKFGWAQVTSSCPRLLCVLH